MYGQLCPNSLQLYGLEPARLLCPQYFPGKTQVGCHFLLQGIFPTHGLNPHFLCLLHWQADFLPLVSPGKPQYSSNKTLKDNKVAVEQQSMNRVWEKTHKCSQMIFCEGTRVNQWGEESLNKWCWNNWSRKMDFGPHLLPYTTVNLMWLINPHIKLSEENTVSLSWYG